MQPPEPQPGAPLTAYEALTAQFYAWEARGRGWQLSGFPVDLEPPFRPFFGHSAAPRQAVDDGRRSTFLGALAAKLRGEKPQPPPLPDWEEDEPGPEPFAYTGPLVEIQVALPREAKPSRERAAQLLSRLASGSGPVTFELIAQGGSVTLQFACPEADRAEMREQILAHYPDAAVRDRHDLLADRWREAPPWAALVDFGLSREFMLPLRIPRDTEVDPLVSICAALRGTRADELAVLQVIFRRTVQPWPQSIMRAVTGADGRPFFADAPEMTARAEEKVSKPLVAAVIRVAVRAAAEARAWAIARSVGGALGQIADPLGNELMPLANDGYPASDHVEDILARLSRRSGMLLNPEEIASIVHLPSAPLCSHPASWSPADIPDSARSRHVYVSGKPGYGKSTAMYWMAMRDIERNMAVAVLDPNGDLAEQILANVPDHRVEDTIYLDGLSPIPLDFMGWRTDQEREVLSDDLIMMFRRLSEGEWGPRMDGIFRYTAYTILEARRTFLDIYRILTSETSRREILRSVKNPDLLEYWDTQFPASNREAVAPIASRMAKFLLTPPLATALGHPHPKLKVAEAIDANKVILVNLKKMGEDAANFYGSMIVSQIQQAVWRRAEIPPAQRKPFYLYVDEFQDFRTSTFGKILSQARKFNLGLTLANQHPKQIGDLIDDVRGCVSTFLTFRMDADHAANLRSAIRPHEPQDLEKLPVFRAMYSACDGTVALVDIPKPPPEPANSRADEIKTRTLQQYAVPPCATRTSAENGGDGDKPDDINSQKRRDPPRHPDQAKGPRTRR
jgi:hypothetical protein